MTHPTDKHADRRAKKIPGWLKSGTALRLYIAGVAVILSAWVGLLGWGAYRLIVLAF